LKATAEADPGLMEKVKSVVEKEVADLGIKVHNGVHATVPFFLSETRKLLTDLKKRGVQSVDMELSVLYALANHHNKKAVGIVRIDDLPLKGLPAWKSRSYNHQLKKEVHKKIVTGLLAYLF
jgi:purine-nucleoside phosphorylase